MNLTANRGGFIAMVFSVLGVVLLCTMFSSILTGLVTILEYSHLSTFTALDTVVEIAPTVLLLGGIFGAGLIYRKGYSSLSAGGTDANGLMRIVFGVLVIILFVSLFYTILTSMYTLYSHANASSFTAFQTVSQIAPTILFLGGIFAGGATAYGGYKARKRRKAL